MPLTPAVQPFAECLAMQPTGPGLPARSPFRRCGGWRAADPALRVVRTARRQTRLRIGRRGFRRAIPYAAERLAGRARRALAAHGRRHRGILLPSAAAVAAQTPR